MSAWKDTLNLPRTDFPMKADLRAAEPRALARWAELGLYERIRGMLAARPDWCISRQRSWGVPIPALQIDHPGLGWPLTLYLEGSDQYRGWFHSSLHSTGV